MEALGRYIVRSKPDAVVHLGDGADLSSIMKMHTKLSAEGERYDADIKAFRAADEALWVPLADYNWRQAQRRQKQYRPRRIYCIGNHENRINRLVADQPNLKGKLGIEDLCLDKYWEEVYAYRAPVFVAGVGFTHNVPTASGKYNLSAPNLARKISIRQKQSWVVGHAHIYDSHVDYRGDGQKFVCFSAGYYGPPSWQPDFTEGTEAGWISGVLLLKNVKDGWPHDGWEWVSQERLIRDFASS
jgi:hypothetical protein